MKLNVAVTVFSLLSVLAFASSAATLVNAEQAKNMNPIGTVTLAAVDSSPMDLREELDKKADEKGASAYRVIELHEGESWHVTAILYK